ncbi:glycosyltransferase [Rhodocista pekingensis]|uniref:Glycosyltransferase n=1 Tax=Rhodocista pekingensis TaxID=201185 RepID=A0ABW2L2D0_9PROT
MTGSLRILLVSWYFPPANTIAAVRIGRMAEALLAEGHDVRVLTAAGLPCPATLDPMVPEARVARAPWWDVNDLPERLLRRSGGRPGAAGGPPAEAPAVPSAPGPARRLRRWAGEVYQHATNLPDSRIGWLPGAVRAGKALVRGWHPDVVYATAPPFTGLLAGLALSRHTGAPLVCEMRDRWSDDPYYPPPGWRLALDRLLERQVLGRAAGIVTVSEPWAAAYRRRFGRPVEVVCNGYDADGTDGADEPLPTPPGPVLTIVYTGGIYPGRRDPSPLFAAIAALGDDAPSVRVVFYGTDPAMVRPLAERHGVLGSVTVLPAVPHRQSVAIQRAADVLLLMQWPDPREDGNVPGKFFEYLGARRPVLLLGLAGGVPDSLLRERGAGILGESVGAIAAQLRLWLAQKRRTGIPPTPPGAAAGFSRAEQFARIAPFLRSLRHLSGPAAGAAAAGPAPLLEDSPR